MLEFYASWKPEEMTYSFSMIMESRPDMDAYNTTLREKFEERMKPLLSTGGPPLFKHENRLRLAADIDGKAQSEAGHILRLVSYQFQPDKAKEALEELETLETTLKKGKFKGLLEYHASWFPDNT